MYAGARSSAPAGQDVKLPAKTEAAGFYNSPSATPTRWTIEQQVSPLAESIRPFVKSRSFSTFFEHPFVFVGLCFLAQIPGAAVGILLRNLGMGGMIVSAVISFVFALVAQGAISYGVYESRRGNAAEFGKSLVCGMTRSGPLLLGGAALIGSFILEAAFGAMLLDSNVLFAVGSLAGIFLVALPMLLLFILCMSALLLWIQLIVFLPAFVVINLETFRVIILFALLGVAFYLAHKSACVRWAVFVPACVIENLGPIASLKRSSELADDVHGSADIMEITWEYLLGSTTFMILGFMAMASIVSMLGSHSVYDAVVVLLTMEPDSIFEALFRTLFRMLIIAIPMAFGYVMIAVTYYELRYTKEQARYYYC